MDVSNEFPIFILRPVLPQQVSFEKHQNFEPFPRGIFKQGMQSGLPIRIEVVKPSPATQAILAVLKVGDTVYQAGGLPNTLKVSNIR